MENKRLGLKQASRFAMVGVFNTAFDFGILNSMVFIFGLSSIVANIISGSIAACVSFFLNQRYVFKADKDRSGRQFVIFILITAMGLYFVQNIFILLLTKYFTSPSAWFFEAIEFIKSGLVSEEFVRLNFAKGIATLASLTWNYFMYSRFVFRRAQDTV